MDNPSNDVLAGRFSRMEHLLITRNQRYTEVETRFEEPGLASGQARIIQMPGLFLHHLRIDPKEILTMDAPGDGEEIESVFILRGRLTSHFERHSGPVRLQSERHAFQYTPDFSSRHILEPEPFEAFHVHYDIPFLKSLLGAAGSVPTDALVDSLERGEPFFPSPDKLRFDARMEEVLRAMKDCAFLRSTRYLYLEAKTLELFALQLDEVTGRGLPSGSSIRREDGKTLAEVHRFIELNYLEPLSLTQLCRQFGLNEFKLKKGYREQYGTTVFGHIHQLRMRKAKALLAEGSMTVSEVADHIGYAGIHAFSAAFKKAVGYPPSRFFRAGSR
ncbi:helix-turn-helix transcriptional regulator [Larkinella soli]|uniref:helix-turn-helix transcriptional regulator n=1 Tax=Larkinella soli TaxID=1770527 RepID=UPI000FFB8599|nr:AraC family transcriptional regulator [Larkinella soli]